MKLADATDRFTRQLAANGRSHHTRAAYRRDLEALAKWLGNKPDLGHITPDVPARFLCSVAVLRTPDGKLRAALTVNRTKSALRSFFAFCVESGWIKDNPARLIRSSPAAAKEPTTLTEDEIGRLRTTLAEADGPCAIRDSLIFEVLLGTGIRLGLLVRENVRTGDGRPDIPLFRSQSGSATAGKRRLGARQVQLQFAALCHAADLTRRVSVHSLRHTFATRLYHKTGDQYLVQRALGHRQITSRRSVLAPAMIDSGRPSARGCSCSVIDNRRFCVLFSRCRSRRCATAP
ncbi:MAG: tyrosine-type recombinase/integrase [candidate division Zixibacteria bacterium]|nr:tyrosine-type recombinase/integrase [candidate division Zixibacteria bacterium]